MANINVKTSVTAPQEISVNLVREDHLYSETGNIFRLLFEITLTIFSVISGGILAIWNEEGDHKIPNIEYVFWGLALIACVAFALLASRYLKKAKTKNN